MFNHQVMKVIYPVIIELNYLSIQQQLKQYILTQLDHLDTVNVSSFTQSNKPIPLFRLPKTDSITYRCAIAFQSSRHASVSPQTLALEFIANLNSY